jgi:hypothetical protein
MKNSNDTIGNRTRDVPACGAVPQPPATPRADYVIPTPYQRKVLHRILILAVLALNPGAGCVPLRLYYSQLLADRLSISEITN